MIFFFIFDINYISNKLTLKVPLLWSVGGRLYECHLISLISPLQGCIVGLLDFDDHVTTIGFCFLSIWSFVWDDLLWGIFGSILWLVRGSTNDFVQVEILLEKMLARILLHGFEADGALGSTILLNLRTFFIAVSDLHHWAFSFLFSEILLSLSVFD